jgi:hypothetical protein
MKKLLAVALAACLFIPSVSHARLVTKAVSFKFAIANSGTFASYSDSSVITARPANGAGNYAAIPDTSDWVDLSQALQNSGTHGAVADTVLAVRFIMVNAGTATTNASMDTIVLTPQFSVDGFTPMAPAIQAANLLVSGASLVPGAGNPLNLNSTFAGLKGVNSGTTVTYLFYAGIPKARAIVSTWDVSNGSGTQWRLLAQYIVPDNAPASGTF